MFCVGDKVAHPMHGAGVIDEIVTETVAGARQDYYVFRMPVGGLTLKIPTAAAAASGLRGVWDLSRVQQLLRDLAGLEVERFHRKYDLTSRRTLQQLRR